MYLLDTFGEFANLNELNRLSPVTSKPAVNCQLAKLLKYCIIVMMLKFEKAIIYLQKTKF